MNKPILPALIAALAFQAPAVAYAEASMDRSVGHFLVEVAAANDEWTRATIKVKEGQLIFLRAPGKVSLGTFYKAVSADGVRSEDKTPLGTLQLKLGPATVINAGSTFAFEAKTSGTFKLRIYDSKYSDNDGKLDVVLYVVPRDIIPVKPTKANAED